MYNTIYLKAILVFFTIFGGSLITLFQGQGVTTFGDVTPVQYATSFITAMIAAIGVVQAQLSDSPANVKQANEIVAAAANLKQGGFARIWSLICLMIASLVLVAACGMITPRKTIASFSTAIEDLAVQVDAAQKAGQITDEQEDHLMDELKKVNADLRTATFLTGDQKTQTLDDVNRRLIELRVQLANEAKK